MTSELRPAVEVWCDAYDVWGDPAIQDTGEADKIAADVIEAYGDEREAKGRAEQAAELAKFKALAETLADALRKIDRMNNHPEWFRTELNVVLLQALRKWEEARDAS